MSISIGKHGRALFASRRWRRVLLAGSTGLSLLLLLWGLVSRWDELRSYQWQFNWLPLGLSGATFSISLSLAVLAWVLTMRTLSAASTWRQDAKFFFYSWMARRLPTPGPYLASRVLLYEEIGVPKRLTSVGLLWENVLLIASGALLTLLLLPMTPLVRNHVPRGPILLAAAASLLVVVQPSLLERAVNWLLRQWGKAPLASLVDQRAAAMLLAVYALVWLTGGLILFFLIRAIYPVEWSALPLVLESWVVSGLVAYLAFFAPAGLGVREVALAYLLALAIPLPVAVIAGVLARLWLMVNELLWALVAYKL
ncbi:MAG: hypothetical protein M5U01_11185 [Ardenticatenaceae bacterium]|nr:hypothetical protein [Ardenticatenaceae bacterium]